MVGQGGGPGHGPPPFLVQMRIQKYAMAIFTLALIYDTVLYAISIFRDDFAEMVQADWS